MKEFVTLGEAKLRLELEHGTTLDEKILLASVSSFFAVNCDDVQNCGLRWI
jgi:hypothetical protein